MTTTKSYFANENKRRLSSWRGNFSHVKLANGQWWERDNEVYSVRENKDVCGKNDGIEV